jgi:putative DNA primase/helicase
MNVYPHRKEDYITKMIDLDCDPAAKCPRFNTFLAETFDGNVGLIGYVTRLAGYFLTGWTHEQAWWIFHGQTASGKSTFVNVLHGILGPYAFTLPENYFLLSRYDSTDFVTAHLAGVRLATCVETAEGKRLDVVKMKRLTGEDPIAAQFKYQGVFTFKPQCKLVLVTNHPPHVPAGDDALWRRLKIVPFTHTVPEEKRVKGLAEQLIQSEGSGIINWAIGGCQDWQRHGLQEPKEVTDAVKKYRTDEDVTQDFVDASLILEPSARSLKSEIYAKYMDWTKSEGIKPRSKKYLGQELLRLGVTADADFRHYTGVRIRQFSDA